MGPTAANARIRLTWKVVPIKNVLEYLEQTARLHPVRPACVEETRACCYQELARSSQAVGSALSHCIRPREPVAVYLEKSAAALFALFGVVYAGGFYVSLNTQLPPARLRQIQGVLKARYVITDKAHAGDLEEVFPRSSILLIEELAASGIRRERLKAIRDSMIDTDPLYANFTSGSTGVPKGVVVSHRSVIDFIEVFIDLFSLTQADRIASQAPFDFDVSVKDIYASLKTGAALVIVPRRLFSRPKELLDFLCENKITTMIWAVSALCLISSLHGLDYRVPDTVRQVLFSGEVMPLKHLKAWMEHLPRAKFVNLYGPTEITCNCTYHVVQRERDYTGGIPIGRPFPNEEVFLLDGADREIKQPHMTGELCVSGTALALGYYRSPDQTAAVFTPDPRNPGYGERIYRTGDLGRYSPEGELYYCGRKDFQIKYMGHRIELEEIERTVSALPRVERCCCVLDVSQQKIRGFYMGAAEPVQLRREISRQLPGFMVPATLERVAQLPLTKNGKVDRQRLLERREECAGTGDGAFAEQV